MSVAEILKPDNFSNYEESHHRKIYEVICSFGLGDTCNSLTVTVKYRRLHGKSHWEANYITGLTATCYNSDPRYYAIRILEMDIRQKTMKYLKEQEAFMNQKERYEESDIYKQCHDLMDDPGYDLIEGVEGIDKFIKENSPDEHIGFEKFKEDLPKISNRIKDMVKLRMGIAQLQNIYKALGGSIQQEKCMMATEILVGAITRNDLSEDFHKHLLKTYQTL